jgi:hypothetical protein
MDWIPQKLKVFAIVAFIPLSLSTACKKTPAGVEETTSISETPAPGSDADLSKRLVGKWKEVAWGGDTNAAAVGTYKPDGTGHISGTLDSGNIKVEIAITWAVENGYLITKATSSNHAGVPIGKAEASRIISISEESCTTESNGTASVATRVK